MLNVKKIREDFPILKRLIKGKPLVYLDSTATTQKPVTVIDAMNHYYRNYNANVHRGVYEISEEATQAYEDGRLKVAQFIHAKDVEGIIFTKGTTESINLVAQSWGRSRLKAGDEIVLSYMEHHSNLVPWQLVSQQTGAKLKFIPLTPEGKLDLNAISSLLSEKTKIVSLTHISNVLGTMNPIEDIVKEVHAVGAVVIVDGAQSVPHIPVDVEKLGCDFLAFSGHKMLGPTGIGVLYGKSELLDAMPPYQGGGEMISEVQLESSTYRELPGKFEAGTPNIAGVVGLSEAIDYLVNLGMENIQAHEQKLVTYALEEVGKINDIDIYGPLPERGGVVAFNFRGVHPHDVSQILNEDGIAVRAGHHCAQPLMRWLGVAATSRASFYIYNTTEEIDLLVESLKKVKDIFAGVTA